MVNTKNCRAAAGWLSLVAWLGITGCTPPGPRALLQGERLLTAGRYEEAIARLTDATRLLPRNAQAWNHLALAHHHAGQAGDAIRSYRKAIEVDYNLAPPRFNLGCLLLEQKQFAAAIPELTTFTLLQPRMVDGWLKRAQAEMFARQFDAAEKSFRTALNLNAKQPEVWNTLGIVQLYRNRSGDAFQAFNSALQQEPAYAPALLNAAIVSHNYLPRRPVDHRPFALQRYKDYLAGNPAPDTREAVTQVMRQLEHDLSPRVAIAPMAAPTLAPTPVPPALPTNVVTRPQPPVIPVAPTAKTPAPAPAPLPVTPIATNKSPAPITPRLTPTVTSVPAAIPPIPSAIVVVPITPPAAETTPVFRPAPVAMLRPATTRQLYDDVGAEWTGPRYRYLDPATPSAGSRRAAEQGFHQGQTAQRIGKWADAVAAYHRAIQLDGAYFEAYHNLGMSAAQLPDLPRAFAAYETAIALEPESLPARFNFAIALQRGGYLRDSAVELEKLLVKHPREPRAHFALANLYSQQLGQPRRAREHYERVLELDPQHAQATAIRFWLRENL